MNEELSIELCHLTVGYSKKGVHLSQVHQQNNNTQQGVHLSQVHQQSNEAQRLVQLRQLHPLGACYVCLLYTSPSPRD